MERKENSGYMKGFIPFIIAACSAESLRRIYCGGAGECGNGLGAGFRSHHLDHPGLLSGRRSHGPYHGKTRGCSGKEDHHPFKYDHLRRRPAAYRPVS